MPSMSPGSTLSTNLSSGSSRTPPTPLHPRRGCSLPCLTPGDSHSPRHYVSDQPASRMQTCRCTAANPRLNPRITSFSMALGKGTCPSIGLSTKPAFPATQSLHFNSHAATHSWHTDDVTTQPAADLKSPPTMYLFVHLQLPPSTPAAPSTSFSPC